VRITLALTQFTPNEAEENHEIRQVTGPRAGADGGSSRGVLSHLRRSASGRATRLLFAVLRHPRPGAYRAVLWRPWSGNPPCNVAPDRLPDQRRAGRAQSRLVSLSAAFVWDGFARPSHTNARRACACRRSLSTSTVCHKAPNPRARYGFVNLPTIVEDSDTERIARSGLPRILLNGELRRTLRGATLLYLSGAAALRCEAQGRKCGRLP
jgi:hypothetical protein